MNSTFRCFIDTGTLALFDPERLRDRVDAESDWWCSNLRDLDEVRSGVAALVGLGGDGVDRVRVTDEELTADERDYAAGVASGLGLEVASGKLFIGPAECLPGGGSDVLPDRIERGLLLDIGNGAYDAEVYAIAWYDSPHWWSDDRTRPEDAPADLVAVLRPRRRPFAGLDREPILDLDSGEYLFESATRRVGPEPGMILTTRVRKGPSGELCLKECGPMSYRASLIDNSKIAWRNTIHSGSSASITPRRTSSGSSSAR